MEKRKIIFFEIIIIIVLSVLIGSTGTASLFFGDINIIDEGQFAAWASHMLLGQHMFKDIYITYGPFFVYPVYLLFKYFGSSIFSVRSYILSGDIAGIIISLLIMYRLRVPFLARFCVILLMILIPTMQLRQATGLISLYLIMEAIDRKKPLWFFFTGIFTACSILVSPDIGIFVCLIEGIILIWYFLFEKRIGIYSQQIGYGILGFIAVVLPFVLWSHSEGWFGSYLSVTKDVFNSFSGINLPNGTAFPNFLALMPRSFNVITWVKFISSKEILLYWGILFYICTFLYCFIILLKKGMTSRVRDISMLSIFGFCLYFILVGRWGVGHFFFILSPILLISAYYISELIKMPKKNISDKYFSYILIGLLCLSGVRLIMINRPQIITNVTALFQSANDNQKKTRIDNISVSKGQKRYIDSVNKFITKNSKNSKYIFFLSNEPLFYMMSKKLNPTRYDLPYIVITKAKRYEVLAALQAHPPQYIFNNLASWPVDGVSNSQRMPEVAAYIQNHYRKVAMIEKTVVYEYEK